jgi:uncharacterized protein (UPF0335 family)
MEGQMAGKGHNSGDRVFAEELQELIDQIESLNTEKQRTAELIRDVYGEAKARGYDTKTIRNLVALRKRKPDAVAEDWATLEMYGRALGMTVFD